MARNLVGRESVAWVQIPPSPPKKDCPPVGQSFFAGIAFQSRGVNFMEITFSQDSRLFPVRPAPYPKSHLSRP